jgi:3-hydroxyacyl-CoA dehydrogenase
VVREVSDDLAKKGLSRIEGSLGRAVEKGKLAAGDRDAARNRISSTTRLEDLAACDLIIEAIVENLDLKKETYRTLDAPASRRRSSARTPRRSRSRRCPPRRSGRTASRDCTSSTRCR